MHVVIRVDGNEYVSGKSDEDLSAKEVAEEVHQLLNDNDPDAPTTMKTTLNDGGILVLGKEAMSRAQMIYYD